MRRLCLMFAAILVLILLACAGGPSGRTVELEAMPPAAGQSYELLSLVDLTRDRQNGDWVAQPNGELRCNNAFAVARVHVPYRPPAEYDFTVVFTQHKLRNGISLIMPKPGGNAQFFWYLGNEDGKGYGFASNPNKGGKYEGLIQANVKYQTTVQVRRGWVSGCLNGRVLYHHFTDQSDLTCDGWRDMKDKSVLAIACDDPTTFHSVQITEVNGQGTRTR